MYKKENILLHFGDDDLEELRKNPETFWNGIEKIGGNAFMFCKEIEEIVIPEQVYDLYRGTFFAFKGKKVSLPNSIKVIPINAFLNSESLTDVRLGDNVVLIEDAAFSKCHNLKNINLPNSLKTIGFKAFGQCNCLVKVALPKQLETLKDKAFKNCVSLEAVLIPQSLKNVGKDVFAGCNKLQTVVFEINGEKKTLNIVNNKSINPTKIIRTIVEDRDNFDLYKTYYEQGTPYSLMMKKVEELRETDTLTA